MPCPATASDWRTLAQQRLPRFLFDYVDGGAGDERTLAANEFAFASVQLRQRVLVDVSQVDTRAQLAGQSSSLPMALAPVGLAGMMARRGEVQAARAARDAGVPFTLSTVGICPLDEVVAATGTVPWFQLYMLRDRGAVRALLDAAWAGGCRTLVFTVDLPLPGARWRDVRHGLATNGASAALRRLGHERRPSPDEDPGRCRHRRSLLHQPRHQRDALRGRAGQRAAHARRAGLFEGVATGAADGYARMADKPAATLLHLGCGLGNGLANLHNARKGKVPVVNIVGDHATYHTRTTRSCSPTSRPWRAMSRPASCAPRRARRPTCAGRGRRHRAARGPARAGGHADPARRRVLGRGRRAGRPADADSRRWPTMPAWTASPRPSARAASGLAAGWAGAARAGLLAAARIAAHSRRQAAGRSVPHPPGARRRAAGRGAHCLPGRTGQRAAGGLRPPDPGRCQGAGVLLRLSRQEELPGARPLHRAHLAAPTRMPRASLHKLARALGAAGGARCSRPSAPAARAAQAHGREGVQGRRPPAARATPSWSTRPSPPA
jgi:hypothetical protein